MSSWFYDAALKKSNIVPNLIRTPDDLGLVQGGPTHDDIGLGHPRVSFTSPKSRGGNIVRTIPADESTGHRRKCPQNLRFRWM